MQTIDDIMLFIELGKDNTVHTYISLSFKANRKLCQTISVFFLVEWLKPICIQNLIVLTLQTFSTFSSIKIPLRYTHLQKEWVPKELPPINTDFCVNKRIYHIASSSLHSLGLFSMDGINISYKKFVELMEYLD